MSIRYKVVQCHLKDSVINGKWYGKAVSLGTVTTRQLAEEISHSTTVTRSDVAAVLIELFNVMKEHLLNSMTVQLDEIGSFRVGFKSEPSDKEEDFKANQNVEALHIRFLPEQEAENNISSREFLKKAEFINIDTLLQKEKDEENGSEQNGGSQAETVAAPTISGETPFDESTQATISGPDGAEIRYTVDGSAPTAESQLYSEAFTLTDTVLVKAIAIKNGVSSEVASKTFTKNGSGDNGGGFDTGS